MRWMAAILTPLITLCAHAEHDHSSVEEVLVHGMRPIGLQPLQLADTLQAAADSAELLKKAPGANVNRNGPLTGIAQYRGLFGDRISVRLDGAPVLTGGPNAMDAPLSYASPGLLKGLTVHRGLAPVDVAQESLGGHIEASLNRGDFQREEQGVLRGFVDSGYTANGDRLASNLQLVAANEQHKVALVAAHEEGNDVEAGNDVKLAGTHYQRDRFDLSYAWHSGPSNGELFVGRLDTRDSGTPALPMDIQFIETDMAGIRLGHELEGLRLTARLNWADVEHVMDNFSFRQAPASMMRFRSTLATGDSVNWAVQARWSKLPGQLTLGHDGRYEGHSATISNPNSAAFEILNFNNAQRRGLGLFLNWQGDIADWQLQSGVRWNHIALTSDPVAASGMMGMMGELAGGIAQRFNSNDLDRDYSTFDVVIKAVRALNEQLTLQFDLGQKNRAPSYQERYLWLPMPATAGLADGRSYLGNLSLSAETAREINLGLSWSGDNFSFEPQLFYRRIDDYIQGVPASEAAANQLSQMMSGNSALLFDNVDAEMFGVDAAANYRINESWALSSVWSYVRGKRRDGSDNLYRIAPPNLRLALHYEFTRGGAMLETVLVSRQSKVSEFNQEQESPGYGLLNLAANWAPTPHWELRAGVRNLLDKQYADHLAAYNRNGFSDIATGERLAGLGREGYVAVQYQW